MSGQAGRISGRVDVAIVGAGVVGSSIAFHLARLGQKSVLILEREDLPATGSTSRANGGIRAQFTTEPNIQMSLASMAILDALADEIGEPPLYRRAGYLFVTGSPQRLAEMAEAAAFQRSRGVSVELLDADAVRRRAPYVAGPLVGGTFGSRDGLIDPGGLANFFLATALREGVAIEYGAAVEAIGGGRSEPFRIVTRRGEVAATVLINAAGPWAAGIAKLVGVELPVIPVRRQVMVTGPCRDLPRVIPMTIDADTGVIVRREGDRMVVAYSEPDEPPGFDTGFEPEFVERVGEWLEARFPAVAAAGVDLARSWAGLYEVSPDHHGIIGAAEDVPGFVLCNGFSGHGVMHAPAAGRCVAELVTLGRCDLVDIEPLSPSRFARGRLIHERMVL